MTPDIDFSAMSRMAATFAREKPHARNRSSSTPSRSSGNGNRFPGNNAMNRPRMVSAAFPFSCWLATARTSD